MADTIKIAVCDDEKNIRSYLVSLIKRQNIQCSITEYASADAYLSDGKEHDLIFLDIEMGCFGAGLDGMGLARHIRGMGAQKQPVIIFVTGYEKYVYDAFDVGAFQYLVKPVDEQKFAEVFVRAAGQFYRIHRGYLINLFHVERYDRTEVRMANGDKLLFCGRQFSV
ncbi:MAG: response regulator [Lachnospiraceae bacterium]|nr:response regulator [Lachnospiraceae bacterium]